MTHRESAASRAKLLRWFHRHARPLPWRANRSPYRVWVSEIMLQQTQVATVVPYYRRFVREFPNVRRLARARLERVLELWSGLGYYRRARDLHHAARIVARRFNGHFPKTMDAMRSLPGVGEYTARAVLSIACDAPFAVLDGNVARVMARLLALRGNTDGARFRGAIERALDEMLSRRRPGQFNQALMELGQTLCLPRAPKCSDCPIISMCRGHRAGNPEAYPSAKKRTQSEICFLAVAVIRDSSRRCAAVRGLDKGLLERLWNFPAAFGDSPAKAKTALARNLAARFGQPLELGERVRRMRHTITFRSIEVDVYRAELPIAASFPGVRWIVLETLGRAAVSQLTRKVASSLRSDS